MNNLKDDFKIEYTKNELCGHEFIINLEQFYKFNITEVDIAKRLIDYNFHPPTLSWPISKSLMIEPTETEDVEELDRFINAMKLIKREILDNPDIVKNSPYSISKIKNWNYNFSLEQAYFPNNMKKNFFHIHQE